MQKLHSTRDSFRVFLLLWITFAVVTFASRFGSAVAAQPSPESQLQITGTTMGKIQYRVLVVLDPLPEQAEEIRDGVVKALQQVNLQMSTYLEDSDVSIFNRNTTAQWVEVSLPTATVVKRAIEISDMTQGAFDMTVGPAVNAWKFGPDKGPFQPLSDDAVSSLQQRVGYQHVEARLSPPAIRKTIAGLQIDLSAIAKGYAVDQVANFLLETEQNRFLIEVGGEVRTKGQRAGGGQWVVGVEDPAHAMPEQMQAVETLKTVEQQIVEISNRSVATSGDYRNYHDHEGVRYSHTIDPRTCRPVRNRIGSASVIADDCTTADAFATAMMVMGEKQAIEFSQIHQIPMLLITRQADGFQTQIVGDYPLVQVSPKGQHTPHSAGTKSVIPTFIAAFVVFLIATVAMAVGAIFANKPVKGSCGGIAAVVGEDGESSCMVCSKPVSDCTLPKPNS